MTRIAQRDLDMSDMLGTVELGMTEGQWGPVRLALLPVHAKYHVMSCPVIKYPSRRQIMARVCLA